MIEIDKLVRKNVLAMKPYSSARDEYKGDPGIFLDANENPFGSLNRYPDPRQNKLRMRLSLMKGIPIGNIFLGNGSDEIIDLCFRIFCNPGSDRVIIFSPTYGMYEVAASMNDAGVIDVPLLPDFNIDIENTLPLLTEVRNKLLFICSPNNPTGNCFKEEDILTIVENFHGIVIIDEAYIDFTGRKSFSAQISRFPNLIVMQTFSKSMGLASARVGIAYASEDIIKYLFRMKPPYNISTLNQEAALTRLKDYSAVENEVLLIKAEREKLVSSLRVLEKVKRVYPSEANFLLVEVDDADKLYKELVNRRIIVRNRTSVVRNCLRITVGTPAENETLIEAIKNICA
ncbi:MAG: histidinol-phosphate transaminase [Bacteroidales bacterium]